MDDHGLWMQIGRLPLLPPTSSTKTGGVSLDVGSSQDMIGPFDAGKMELHLRGVVSLAVAEQYLLSSMKEVNEETSPTVETCKPF
jgi:hypothetical protein